MYKFILLVSTFIFVPSSIPAQTTKKEKPKVVIGIVVDQMRYSYLEEFWEDYGENGFKRLVDEGILFTQTHYSYKPTYTGPGHATIFTGQTPKNHGIVGNNWFDRQSKLSVYCASIEGEQGVLNTPARLKVKTLADYIKEDQDDQSLSIGISLKDRGAILPVGHSGDAAYWFDGKKGGFRSSEYYERSNEDLLERFNRKENIDQYLSENWKLSREKADYQESSDDNSAYKQTYKDEELKSLPFGLKKLRTVKGYDAIKSVPGGNQILVDFAKQIIVEENLGRRNQMDFLSISFSATDYVGHRYGVQSIEVQDTYIKLDKSLAAFIDFLDDRFGREEYLLFLSSDHGASMPRAYLESNNLPTGYLDQSYFKENIEALCDAQFGKADWIDKIMNLNIYLGDAFYELTKQDQVKGRKLISDWLENQKGIESVIRGDTVQEFQDTILAKASEGILYPRSGDLIILEKMNWTTYGSKGSTHGSPYAYDTHVPFLLFGNGLTAMKIDKSIRVADISPMIAKLITVNMNSLQAVEVDFLK